MTGIQSYESGGRLSTRLRYRGMNEPCTQSVAKYSDLSKENVLAEQVMSEPIKHHRLREMIFLSIVTPLQRMTEQAHQVASLRPSSFTDLLKPNNPDIYYN